MTALSGSLRAELKLTLRSPALWIFAVLTWALTLARVLLSPDYTTWGNINSLTSDYQLLLGVPAALLGVAAACRERVERAEHLIEAVAYPKLAMVGGKLLGCAGATVLLSASIVLQVALSQQLMGLAPVDWGMYGYHWALFLLPTVLFVSTVGFGLGVWLGQARIAYASALGYVIGVLGIATPALRDAGHPLAGLARVSATPVISIHTSLLEYFPDWRLVFAHRAFYLALAAILFVLAARQYGRHGLRLGLVHWAALAVCGGLALGSAGDYVSATVARSAAYSAELASLPEARLSLPYSGSGQANRAIQTQIETVTPIPSEAELRVGAYALDVRLDPAAGTMAVIGRLTLVNGSRTASGPIALTLRQNLAVTAVTAATGDPVSFRRSGPALWLELPAPLAPGETTVLQLTYSGSVLHWRGNREGAVLSLGYYITPKAVHLPGGYGWYPVAGEHVPAEAVTLPDGARVIADRELNHSPALFSVTVSGLGDLTLASNLPVEQAAGTARLAGQAGGCTLIACRYATTTAGPITLYHHPSLAPGAKVMAAQLEDLAAFFRAILPLPHGYNLSGVQTPVRTYRGSPPGMAGLHEAVLGMQKATQGPAFASRDTRLVAVNTWFMHHSSAGRFQSYLGTGVVDFIQSLYRAEREGAATYAAERSVREEWGRQHSSGPSQGRAAPMTGAVQWDALAARSLDPDSNRVWLLLASVLEREGEAACHAVARRLYEVDPLEGLRPGELESIVAQVVEEVRRGE